MRTRYVVCNGDYQQNWFWDVNEAQAYADACHAMHGWPRSHFVIRYAGRIVYDAPTKAWTA
jgi:hypothetical protein